MLRIYAFAILTKILEWVLIIKRNLTAQRLVKMQNEIFVFSDTVLLVK